MEWLICLSVTTVFVPVHSVQCSSCCCLSDIMDNDYWPRQEAQYGTNSTALPHTLTWPIVRCKPLSVSLLCTALSVSIRPDCIGRALHIHTHSLAQAHSLTIMHYSLASNHYYAILLSFLWLTNPMRNYSVPIDVSACVCAHLLWFWLASVKCNQVHTGQCIGTAVH